MLRLPKRLKVALFVDGPVQASYNKMKLFPRVTIQTGRRFHVKKNVGGREIVILTSFCDSQRQYIPPRRVYNSYTARRVQ